MRLELLNVSKIYREYKKLFIGQRLGRETTAVQDVSFTVDEEQFVSLVGPSGCGKSTILKMVSGLVSVDEGKVLVDGQPASTSAETATMVFQNVALLPWRTLAGNVELALELKYHRPLTDEERGEAAHILEAVGLQGFQEYYPKQVSGGMQQRAGLARAMITNPTLLLMDEPFGALDAQTRVILQDQLLRFISQRNTAVLFVTHDLDEAIYLSDKVIILSRSPGHIKKVITVGTNRKVRDEEFRTSEEFVELKRDAWQTLKGELTF